MDLSTELVIIAILSGAAIVLFLLSLLYSVAGAWVKCYPKSTSRSRLGKEKIVLSQLGPFVTGRSETISGGYHLYFGYSLGPKVWLKRRDYGIASLIRQGFPKEIAADLEGQIMAKYKLTLDKEHLFLEGLFTPYKVSFNHSSAKITAMQARKPTKRVYQRAAFVSKKNGRKSASWLNGGVKSFSSCHHSVRR